MNKKQRIDEAIHALALLEESLVGGHLSIDENRTVKEIIILEFRAKPKNFIVYINATGYNEHFLIEEIKKAVTGGGSDLEIGSEWIEEKKMVKKEEKKKVKNMAMNYNIAKIEAVMKEQKISRHKLAIKAGISPPDIYSCFSGAKPFYPSWRKRIADVLQVREEDLFEEEKDT